ncbi:MAG: hypothetical protein MJ223_02770 [Mycoplasmoidaceae bacterium]|nr:hypothetical protein [Mycoplasmoidaceae bacterium]
MLNNDKIVLPTISLAEINYVVYKIISADYHSMLYGYLSSLLTEKDNRMLITDFDKKIISLMGNNPTLKNDPFHKKDVSLPTYIRNCIDHPENKQRVIYTDDELTKSIEILRKIIEQIKKDSN